MKKSVFLLVLLFSALASFGQIRPKCITCKEAEFTNSSLTIAQSRPKEISISEVEEEVSYQYKPSHLVCYTDTLNGRVCTKEVNAEMRKAKLTFRRIITVEYVPIEMEVAVMVKKYDAELEAGNCD